MGRALVIKMDLVEEEKKKGDDSKNVTLAEVENLCKVGE